VARDESAPPTLSLINDRAGITGPLPHCAVGSGGGGGGVAGSTTGVGTGPGAGPIAFCLITCCPLNFSSAWTWNCALDDGTFSGIGCSKK
jgi:hypothetical protein